MKKILLPLFLSLAILSIAGIFFFISFQPDAKPFSEPKNSDRAEVHISPQQDQNILLQFSIRNQTNQKIEIIHAQKSDEKEFGGFGMDAKEDGTHEVVISSKKDDQNVLYLPSGDYYFQIRQGSEIISEIFEVSLK